MIALSKPASFSLFNFSRITGALYHLSIWRAGEVPNTHAENAHIYTQVHSVNTHQCREMINEAPLIWLPQPFLYQLYKNISMT